MEVQELKKLIKENNIPNFLIFTGEEYEVQRQYIKQIAKVKNLSTYYAEDIDEIWRNLDVQSLFSDDKLYILRDDKELLTNEKVYNRILDKLANNMLILQLTSADKRLKMLKQYNNSIVEFNTLNEAILKQYIQREIDLNDRNCEILMEICEYNYGAILLEIDKIKKYKADTRPTTLQSNDINHIFVHLLDDGTIHIPPRDVIWDFIKAFLQNKPLQAYELYQELKELETPTFSILSNLYNNARAVFQVQTCASNDIAKSTGLSAWQIRNAKECIHRFDDMDLEVILKIIQRTEMWVKQGKIDESIAIDYIFTSVF